MQAIQKWIQSRTVRVVISVLILVALVYWVGIQAMVDTLARAKLSHIIYLTGAVLLGILFGAIGVKMLLPPTVKIPFVQLVEFFSIGFAAGFFTPGRLGEFSTVYFLKKHGLETKAAVGIMLLDRMITMVVLILVTSLAVLTLVPSSQVIWAYLVISALIIVMISVALSQRVQKTLIQLAQKWFKQDLTPLFDVFISNRKNPNGIFINIIMTLLRWVVFSGAFWFIFNENGILIQWWQVLGVNSLVTLISLVPISLSGIGVREAAAVILYQNLNVPAALTTYAFLLALAINAVLSVLILLGSTLKSKG